MDHEKRRMGWGWKYRDRRPSPRRSPVPVFEARSRRRWGWLDGFRELRARVPTKALLTVCFIIAALFLYAVAKTSVSPPAQKVRGPSHVLVLVLNAEGNRKPYLDKIVDNRREYAHAHGYGLFVRKTTDYERPSLNANEEGEDLLSNMWARVPAVREAVVAFPHSEWFWILDQDAIIMNPVLSLSAHVTDPSRLSSLMLRDIPIVPPDSVIRTPKYVPATKIDVIVTQDHTGLHPGSMLIRRNDFSEYLLDAWYDPMFRDYGFPKGEQDTLEHLAQWHTTILAHIAVIPQRIVNAYPNSPRDTEYQDGDFVVHFDGCEAPERSCEKEFLRFWDERGRVDAEGLAEMAKG